MLCILILFYFIKCGRHTDEFYKLLATPVPLNSFLPRSAASVSGNTATTTVASALAAACADDDSTTRKFACFAGSNYNFFSDITKNETWFEIYIFD